MTKKRLARLGVLLLILGVLCLSGGLVVVSKFSGAPVVTLINESSTRLTQITLTGETWRHPVPDIEPGTKTTVTPKFAGETGMSLSYSAGGPLRSPKTGIYLESSGGYRIKAVIHPDLTATMTYEGSR